jgi:glucose-1-phosphate thymidylyltransferase
MKLLVPMAGRGTRVRPHSHVTPKPLLTVKGRPIVGRIVDLFHRVLETPPDEGVFVLGPDFGQDIKDQLVEVCNKQGMDAHFTVQEEALGTAHAVGSAGPHLEGDGIVVFADTLFDMEPGVELAGSDVVAFTKEVDDPSRFGIAVRDGEEVTRLVEKPEDPVTNEALIGIYYVRDLDALRDEIEYLIDNDLRGKGDEYQLTDAFDRMLQDGKKFTTAGATAWMDCGTIPALLDTTGRVLERESDDLLHGTIEDSVIRDPVYLGPGAEIRGAVVGPHVSVEAGATIENAVVEESIVFQDAQVTDAVLDGSVVGRSATVRQQSGSLNIGDHSSVE